MWRMHQWEYCVVNVALYREGGGGPPRELLSITLPGEQLKGVTNALGLVGLLNQLGCERWELVDVEAGSFYLKRPVKS
jgi:hypothetical protein